MGHQNVTVNHEGHPQPCSMPKNWSLLRTPYRFYRFLTEIEDQVNDDLEEENIIDEAILLELHILVRKLLLNSYWIQSQMPEIEEETGTGVLNLYDETGFPFTVQTVAMKPGETSTIHNHGTWGVVAILKGLEKNTLWTKAKDVSFPNKLTKTTEIILQSGDIISFSPDAIHCIEAVGDEPLITFNIYGETYHQKRFEFDLETHQAINY
jgi:predicted metal-dependent enzyme (double-stranded beta helix superfamily)